MPTLEVRPARAEDLVAAADLLARRHQAHRNAFPQLPARFEAPALARAEVEALWQVPDASGAVAIRDGEVTGFLLGVPKKSDVWGPNVWVEAAGQAATDPEALRDLYAVAATRWVEEGRTAHYVLTPTHDPRAMDAWFRVGFGAQHAHAVRDTQRHPATVPDGLTVRRPVRADIPVLARLELLLDEHQMLAPTFSAAPALSLDEAVADWTEDFDDDGFTTFVAEQDGRVVGSAVGCSVEKSSGHAGLARPENAALLSFAAVLPEARRLGAGRALGESVLHWADGAGYDTVVTDWRVTNLHSSRAWTALGFRPTFLRLHRLVRF